MRIGMAERTEREGLSPVAAELPQEETQRPATPVYRRGYYFDEDHDHDHHEKRSVLTKVKDKAKKWKNILAKKKHPYEGDSPRSWSSALDEEDEEGDPEYHGAPMYESKMATRAYEEMGTHHRATAQSLNPLALHRGNSPNQLATLLNDHQEPALYHLNATKETLNNHITVSDALEASPKHESSMKERSSNSADHHQVSDAMARTKKSNSNRANYPLSHRTHQLRANTKRIDANDSNDEFLDTNILQANTRYTTNHPYSDTHLLVAKHTNPTTSIDEANHPAVSSSTHLLMGNKEHGVPTNDNSNNKIYHSTFSDSQLLMANRNHGDLIRKSSSSTKNHPTLSGENLTKANNEGSIKKRDSRSGNQLILSGTHLPMFRAKRKDTIEKNAGSRLNDHASPCIHLSRSKPTESIKENDSNKGKRNNEEPIESLNNNLNHPEFSNANHLVAKTNCKDCNYGSASNRTLPPKVSEMLAPVYGIASDISHTIALKILCPTDGDEMGALQAHDPVKELTETISKMFTPARSMVSDISHKIASKINGPTDRDEVGAKIALEPLTRSGSNKTITETMSQMLNPACFMVSDGSHKTTQKIHESAVRDVIGAKQALEPLTESSSNKKFTETLSEMLNPACSVVSDASSKIAPKVHGSAVTDEIGAKLALEPLTESSRTLTETMSEMLAPAYTVVSDASQKIASKIQGPSALDEIAGKMAHDPIFKNNSTSKPLTCTMSETLAPAYTEVPDASHKEASNIQGTSVQTEKEGKQTWDKGVSVKEYLRHKLSPGEEDRALSQVITESMSPRRTVPLAKGSLVEKARAAVSSFLGKEGHSKSTTTVPSMLEVKKETTAGLILPVSTSPHAVEIEEINVKRVQAYTY